MKQSSDDELKAYIFGGYGLQIHDQVIKRWRNAHEMYHVHIYIFNLHLNGM